MYGSSDSSLFKLIISHLSSVTCATQLNHVQLCVHYLLNLLKLDAKLLSGKGGCLGVTG